MDEDPELFFPVGTSGPALGEAAAARRLCARCPVRHPCLAWALSTGQTAGVWGGMGEGELAELLRDAGTDHRARRGTTTRRSTQ